MSIQIVQSSPKANEVAERKKGKSGMYPFADLEIGQSFTVPLDQCNWKSLRVSTYQKNARAKDGREFAFIKHDDLNIVEVARIA